MVIKEIRDDSGLSNPSVPPQQVQEICMSMGVLGISESLVILCTWLMGPWGIWEIFPQRAVIT